MCHRGEPGTAPAQAQPQGTCDELAICTGCEISREGRPVVKTNRRESPSTSSTDDVAEANGHLFVAYALVAERTGASRVRFWPLGDEEGRGLAHF